MENQSFKLLNVSENADITWSTHENMTETAALSFAGEGELINLDIKDFENRALEAEWASTNESDANTNKIRIGIKVQRTAFTMIELYASDANNTDRLAKSGQTLYLMKALGVTNPNDRNRRVNFTVGTSAKTAEISEEDIVWDYSDINGTRIYDRGEINIVRNIWERDLSFKTSVEVGNPVKSTKSIDVEWFERDYNKTKFSLSSDDNPFLKKVMEATKMTENASKFFDKIPFIKKVKDKGAFSNSGINWFFEITPFEQTLENKEEEESPLYFTEKTIRGGFEAGLRGKVNIWTWGLPWNKLPIPDAAVKKLKSVITAEINIVASADVKGELIGESIEKKILGSEKWKTESQGVNPAALSLNAAFGVEGEISAFKESEWLSLSATASGLARAELLSIGYFGNEFKTTFLREGVWMDFNAEFYVIVGGFKLETTPYYQRVQLIEPFKNPNE